MNKTHTYYSYQLLDLRVVISFQIVVSMLIYNESEEMEIPQNKWIILEEKKSEIA